MRKANVLFLVLVVGMIVFCGISYAAVAGFVNAAAPAAVETGKATIVEGAVRGEGEPLASNATLIASAAQLIGEIKEATTAPVSLTGDVATDALDQRAYAIGLASVMVATVEKDGVGGYKINVPTDGKTGVLDPRFFSDTYVQSNIAGFQSDVAQLTGNQIALIVTTNPEEIEKIAAVKGMIDDGKVAIVKLSDVSKDIFTQLFDLHGQGFSLEKAGGIKNPLVAKALQGAV